jgi:hypothetical protein
MNKVVPVVEITLDKARAFKLDFKALMAFEKLSGKNVLESNVWQHMTASDMVMLLWAGLVHEDPQLTLDMVAGFIHPGNIQLVVNALQQGFQIAMPENKEAEGAEKQSPLSMSRQVG